MREKAFKWLQFEQDFDIVAALKAIKVFLKVLNGNVVIMERIRQ